MKFFRTIVAGLLLPACVGLTGLGLQSSVHATDRMIPAPVSKALDDVLAQTSQPAIAGFDWGSPVEILKASNAVKSNPDLSARCVREIVSTAGPDCTAFVPISRSSFARALYATARDGLMMVETKATRFDCAHFDDLAAPDSAHRVLLADHGWKRLRRERRAEGNATIVETQLYTRHGIGVDLTFIRIAGTDACGVKSFVSKVL